MAHRRRLKLLAGAFSTLTGILFLVLPGHTGRGLQTFNGLAWLLIGALWLLAYRIERRRPG